MENASLQKSENMQVDKLNFLRNTYPELIRKLDPSTKREWGKMNVQQMIEHMSDFIRMGNGKLPQKIFTPAEHLPRLKEFLMSDKEFRPDTKNAMLGEEPLPVVNSTVKEAVKELELELTDFNKFFQENPQAIVTNPIFGDLNFYEWVQLIYKHSRHHLRQFGVSV